MNAQQFEELDHLFSQAQVDLPPHLKARLLAIPHMAQPASFWDASWMLPAVALVPAILWLMITKASALWSLIVTKAASLLEGVALPTISLPAISPPPPSLLAVGIGMGVVVAAAGLCAWYYLHTENQALVHYARKLTAAN